MKRQHAILIGAIFLAIITLPYIFAALNQGPNHVFGGFLLNPTDGNSYLAKMRIGAGGEWLFHLPYSIEQGQGAYLFLFYIFLGWVGAGLNIPPLLTFHLARILAAGFLFYTLYRLIKTFFPAWGAGWQAQALILLTFGSGLGWIATLFGAVTGDLWVAEGYPFLSGYTNPHFPLGLGLILWILMLSIRPFSRRSLWIFPLGLLLAVILPFGIVICGVVLGVDAGWSFLETRKLKWREIILLGAGGGLFLIYQYAAILGDPVLSAWNSQNQTPAPGILDFVISLCPALVFALPGAWRAWQEKKEGAGRILLIWFLAGFILIYLPINIQRRFFSGFFIPVALLAVWGIRELGRLVNSKSRVAWFVFGGSVPTLLVIVAIGFFGSLNLQPAFFLESDEIAGFRWLGQNLPAGSVVAAGPLIGSYIPAYTSLKVVYGHPFETIRAVEREKELQNFYGGKMTAGEETAWIKSNGIRAIYFSKRDEGAADPYLINTYPKVFQAGDVEIYAIP